MVNCWLVLNSIEKLFFQHLFVSLLMFDIDFLIKKTSLLHLIVSVSVFKSMLQPSCTSQSRIFTFTNVFHFTPVRKKKVLNYIRKVSCYLSRIQLPTITVDKCTNLFIFYLIFVFVFFCIFFAFVSAVCNKEFYLKGIFYKYFVFFFFFSFP